MILLLLRGRRRRRGRRRSEKAVFVKGGRRAVAFALSSSAASAHGRQSHHQHLPRALCGRVQRGGGGSAPLPAAAVTAAASAAAALEQRGQHPPESGERHCDPLPPRQGSVLPRGDLGAEHEGRVGEGGEREGDESLGEREREKAFFFCGAEVREDRERSVENKTGSRRDSLFFSSFQSLSLSLIIITKTPSFSLPLTHK